MIHVDITRILQNEPLTNTPMVRSTSVSDWLPCFRHLCAPLQLASRRPEGAGKKSIVYSSLLLLLFTSWAGFEDAPTESSEDGQVLLIEDLSTLARTKVEQLHSMLSDLRTAFVQ